MTPKKKHHQIRHKAGLTVSVAGVRIRFWKRGTPMVTVTTSEAVELRTLRKKKHGAPLGNQNAKQRDHFDPFVKTADDLASQFGVSSATVKRSADFAKGVDVIEEKRVRKIYRNRSTRAPLQEAHWATIINMVTVGGFLLGELMPRKQEGGA
jgi:hypothetical protein